MDTITPFVLTERQLRNFNKKIITSTTHSYNETPCQEWTGCRLKKGYGHFGVNGKLQVAHRVAWLLAHGEIPVGLCVLHRCDNPPCVEVSHLFTGTKGDNNRDREAKGRGNQPRGDNHGARTKPECLARGSKNGSAKLEETDILEVFRLRSYGMTLLEIGEVFGVRDASISLILNRRNWAHVQI